MQFDAIWCNLMQFDAIWCDSMQFDVIRFDVIQKPNATDSNSNELKRLRIVNWLKLDFIVFSNCCILGLDVPRKFQKCTLFQISRQLKCHSKWLNEALLTSINQSRKVRLWFRSDPIFCGGYTKVRAAVWSKIDKTVVSPGFFKIECGGGSHSMLLCYRVLFGLEALALPDAPLKVACLQLHRPKSSIWSWSMSFFCGFSNYGPSLPGTA